MTVFGDSSALVKRYADERGHELVRAIEEPLAVSALARVEVPSALWRKQRDGALAAEDAAVLVAQFDVDWYGTSSSEPAFVPVGVTLSILEAAATQVARHALRAVDSVQLATALAVRALDASTSFAAFDVQLRAAAAREGFDLIPRTVSARS